MENTLKYSILNEIFQAITLDKKANVVLVVKTTSIHTLRKSINTSDKSFIGVLISLKENDFILLDWQKNTVSVTEKGIAALY